MRLFVTGVSGYLGGIVTRALEADSAVDKVIGIDISQPESATDKLEFHRMDVRDPAAWELMTGCDAVLHMAFVLNEIRDKRKTDDINVRGSKNIFDGSIKAGVPWIIQLSSMAAFGPHPDNPVPLTEDHFPRGHPRCYYCRAKAELEHYLCWLAGRNPGLDITVLRPTVIIGEKIDNTVAWMFKGKYAAAIKGHDSLAQYIHEDDLAAAVTLVLDRKALGVYHVTSDDCIRVSEMMRRMDMFAPPLPKGLLCSLADLSFAVGASPISSHWIRMFSESMVGTSERLKALGWQPGWTSSDLFDEYIVKRFKRQP